MQSLHAGLRPALLGGAPAGHATLNKAYSRLRRAPCSRVRAAVAPPPVGTSKVIEAAVIEAAAVTKAVFNSHLSYIAGEWLLRSLVAVAVLLLFVAGAFATAFWQVGSSWMFVPETGQIGAYLSWIHDPGCTLVGSAEPSGPKQVWHLRLPNPCRIESS